jgi:peptide/nickel transport system substrate-binding protein
MSSTPPKPAGGPRQRLPRKSRLAVTVSLALVLVVTIVVLLSNNSPNRSSSSKPTTTTSSQGTTTTLPPCHCGPGVVYWAQSVDSDPNWIFPFTGLQYYTVANVNQFQYLMFRPLYWFGPPGDEAPVVDYALSPGDQPKWTDGDKTVTIDLKDWKFGDGERTVAESVIFWMNMVKAEGCEAAACHDNAQWAGTVPGGSEFPGNIASYSAPHGAKGDVVVLNLTHAVNETWFQYNELSQITPMAEAWDVTSLDGSPGSGGCGRVSARAMTGAATLKACEAVWAFDTDNGGRDKHPVMAAQPATYATNKLWREGTDGPWDLSGFDASTGEATFVPNPTYSGLSRPVVGRFVELPYASATAEFDALAGSGGTAPEVGYIPLSYTPQKPASLAPTVAGPNAEALVAKYNLVEGATWQLNYAVENFDSTSGAGGHAGSVFRQLYVRQALQELVDQPSIIAKYYKGYGVPTTSPIPTYPPSPFTSSLASPLANVYPYSPSAAGALLAAHGWKVDPGGVTTCVHPGTGADDCGGGIPEATPLKFRILYSGGSPTLMAVVRAEVADWAKVGIDVALEGNPFDNVLSAAVRCPVPPTKPTKACQSWDIVNWGGGWLYSPDYMPTGEEFLELGAASNLGSFDYPENNRLINETNESPSSSPFSDWVHFIATELPVIWQPLPTDQVEIAKDVGGVTLNSLGSLMPEYWYYCRAACS